MVLARQHIVSGYHSCSLIPRLSPTSLPLCLLIPRLSPTSLPCASSFSGSPLPPSPVPPHSFFFGWGGGGGRHRGEAGNLYYYITCIQNHFSYLNVLCLDVLTDSAWNSRADSWSQPVCLWHSLFLLCLLWPGG